MASQCRFDKRRDLSQAFTTVRPWNQNLVKELIDTHRNAAAVEGPTPRTSTGNLRRTHFMSAPLSAGHRSACGNARAAARNAASASKVRTRCHADQRRSSPATASAPIVPAAKLALALWKYRGNAANTNRAKPAPMNKRPLPGRPTSELRMAATTMRSVLTSSSDPKNLTRRVACSRYQLRNSFGWQDRQKGTRTAPSASRAPAESPSAMVARRTAALEADSISSPSYLSCELAAAGPLLNSNPEPARA